MKQTVGTTTLFKIILAFTFLFAAFLAVAITYNKVYKIKNETLSILEKYEGVTPKSLEIVNNYLQTIGYNTLGNCQSGEYGVADLNSNTYESVKGNKRYYYCLRNWQNKNPNVENIYYGVTFFFKFNLPFFGDLMIFKINGETKAIRLYNNSQKLK